MSDIKTMSGTNVSMVLNFKVDSGWLDTNADWYAVIELTFPLDIVNRRTGTTRPFVSMLRFGENLQIGDYNLVVIDEAPQDDTVLCYLLEDDE